MEMIDKYQPRKSRSVGAASTWLGILAAALLTACTSEKSTPTQKKSTPVATTQATSSTAAAAAPGTGVDNKLEFYTERYLASEERLKRRQDRIDQTLNAPK